MKISHIRNAITAAPLAYRPGHYYSPICDPRELVNLTGHRIDGVDFRRDAQLARWKSWQHLLPASHWKHYSPDNSYYSMSDAIPLYGLLLELKPRRLIEVGCGFSSAVTLDTLAAGNLATRCTFIDPNPERLRYPLDGHGLLKEQLQSVPLTVFDELEAGDILFIDSTHVLKTGSDVAHYLFQILPRLNRGVFVHFHDIFYPFEYPHEWIKLNYSWNEIYALHALLTNSTRYQIEFWNDYLTKTADVPLPGGSSLWISVM